MFPIALVLLAQVSAPRAFPFEIHSNKPFVQVTIDGSAPQWFILDSGNNGPTLIARECADRLKIGRSDDAKADIGAGSGADVRLSTASQVVRFEALGETMTVAQPRVLTLDHVARVEGHQVDGLLGYDFFSRFVVAIDYEKRTMTAHDPARYQPPSGAVIVPLDVETTGWPVASGTITTPGGKPLPCRLIIDTGVRFTIALFNPFSARHGLYEPRGGLSQVVTGSGAGGLSHGDVGRLDSLTIGSLSFARPVGIYSRDNTGVFALDGPDGIVGGEVLRRFRVSFDYPHRRMILEPYPLPKAVFEHDMSGLFLGSDGTDYSQIRVLAVNPGSPAANAKLQVNDEILAIDGKRVPQLSLDQARALLRTPATRRLEIRRAGQTVQASLVTKRMV